jgi:hypothetical protein
LICIKALHREGKDRATQTPLKTEGELNFHYLLKACGVEALCKFCTEENKIYLISNKFIDMYLSSVIA